MLTGHLIRLRGVDGESYLKQFVDEAAELDDGYIHYDNSDRKLHNRFSCLNTYG